MKYSYCPVLNVIKILEENFLAKATLKYFNIVNTIFSSPLVGYLCVE